MEMDGYPGTILEQFDTCCVELEATDVESYHFER